MKFFWIIIILFLASKTTILKSQERIFCEGEHCTDNTLKLVFDNGGHWSSEGFTRIGESIRVRVVADIVEVTNAWAMGVRHDKSVLELESVSIEGLDLPTEFISSIKPAVGDPAPGFVCAYIAAFLPAPGEFLEPGKDIPLVEARYSVSPNFFGQTKLEFTENLIPTEGSPPVSINFNIDNRTLKPKTLTEGVLNGFHCHCFFDFEYAVSFGDDPVFDPRIHGTEFSIRMLNPWPVKGFSLGVLFEDGVYTFASNRLGASPDHLIENNITDLDGQTFQLFGNIAKDAKKREILSIERGAALLNLQGDDFLHIDLEPTVGGSGFIVEYTIAEGKDSAIPPSPNFIDACRCSLNELLVVKLPERTFPEFVRGDCNDDGFIDISDPLFNLTYQFTGSIIPSCLAALDTNADTNIDLSDPIYNLKHQFSGTEAPPSPYPFCGIDSLPQGEAMPCEKTSTVCE